jgi:poly-gamma-glutamate synthesis protein (capsule biosynthesis protein)
MRIIITGDIALAGSIGRNKPDVNGCFLSEDIIHLFSEKDLCLINLECPLTDSTSPKWGHFPTLKANTKTIRILNGLNVDVASLANNHIYDYGEWGFTDTVSVLEKNKIAWVGAGWTPKEANSPLIYSKNNNTIGIVALAQREIAAVRHDESGSGILTEKRAICEINKLKNNVDVIIAYLHFGVEFYAYPTPDQVKLCRLLIDEGASLVIGHHPHVVQGYEFYKEGFIAYSLGNFIFDMKSGHHEFSRLGMVIDVEIDNKKIKQITMPLFDTANGSTVLLHGNKKKDAEAYVEKLSSVLSDRPALIENYYFTCRDHFKSYLSAFLYFLFIKKNMRNCYDWIIQEFWPQILKLRIDLVRFVISGQALGYELKKGKPEEGALAYVWRGICHIGNICGFFGAALFTVK